ncbi:hypothetical protein BJ085DRAFT_43585 [Dimargaris cristalligena]|uniref:Uncharacterized protein n=1 Tax=Dimargaris cristalligena TaxID=215637 RepID=A0A4P9ZL90_9FUNG|nr:hypothetical protein BJ085DRAFT_43585 [Dimargaris cristalligena]|eukprot:RKP33875.1 hypothetical protein BJ085DRAFT_43585 [Dimargaris cristalligena]
MPLDVLGRTRATLMKAARIPSKRESSARVDYVPALCTHRPSLLPIEWLSETLGLAVYSRQRRLLAEKLVKLGHLEENSVNHRIFERTLRSLHDNLVSNQARKPAELKHINKRRKRN